MASLKSNSNTENWLTVFVVRRHELANREPATYLRFEFAMNTLRCTQIGPVSLCKNTGRNLVSPGCCEKTFALTLVSVQSFGCADDVVERQAWAGARQSTRSTSRE
jgi:hypothetical protein